MPILYESKEDQKRVEKLNQQGKNAGLLGDLSFLVAGLGGGLLGRGFWKKNENLKTGGWATLVAGLSGVIYSLWKSMKVSSELRKPENENLILEGKPLKTDLVSRIGYSLREPLQGEPLPPGTEIVQGRKAWEAKMAERKEEVANNNIASAKI